MSNQESLAGAVFFIAMAAAMMMIDPLIPQSALPKSAPVAQASATPPANAPMSDQIQTAQAATTADAVSVDDGGLVQNLVLLEEITLQSLSDALGSQIELGMAMNPSAPEPTPASMEIARRLRAEIISIQERMKASAFDAELSARRWSALESADRALEQLGSVSEAADKPAGSPIATAS